MIPVEGGLKWVTGRDELVGLISGSPEIEEFPPEEGDGDEVVYLVSLPEQVKVVPVYVHVDDDRLKPFAEKGLVTMQPDKQLSGKLAPACWKVKSSEFLGGPGTLSVKLTSEGRWLNWLPGEDKLLFSRLEGVRLYIEANDIPTVRERTERAFFPDPRSPERRGRMVRSTGRGASR